MADVTARFALPLLVPGQAQKEMTHNEALALIDIATQACVAAEIDAPPADPEIGACWIVGSTPTGAWAGQAAAIAGWTDGGWRFVPAREGMSAWVSDDQVMLRHAGGIWSRATPAAPVAAIPRAAGGTVIDGQARAALASILAALEHHGLVETPNL